VGERREESGHVYAREGVTAIKGVILIGRSSQRKGADGERELANILREHGYTVERGGSLSFGEAPDLTGLPGVHIEVKRRERLELAE